jgi:phage shock protein A
MSSELDRVNPPADQMIKMMRRASGEIKELRKIIDAIGPRAEAYEMIKKILSMVPGPGSSAGEDVAWTLDQEANKLEEKLNRARMPAGGVLSQSHKPMDPPGAR